MTLRVTWDDKEWDMLVPLVLSAAQAKDIDPCGLALPHLLKDAQQTLPAERRRKFESIVSGRLSVERQFLAALERLKLSPNAIAAAAAMEPAAAAPLATPALPLVEGAEPDALIRALAPLCGQALAIIAHWLKNVAQAAIADAAPASPATPATPVLPVHVAPPPAIISAPFTASEPATPPPSATARKAPRVRRSMLAVAKEPVRSRVGQAAPSASASVAAGADTHTEVPVDTAPLAAAPVAAASAEPAAPSPAAPAVALVAVEPVEIAAAPLARELPRGASIGGGKQGELLPIDVFGMARVDRRILMQLARDRYPRILLRFIENNVAPAKWAADILIVRGIRKNEVLESAVKSKSRLHWIVATVEELNEALFRFSARTQLAA